MIPHHALGEYRLAEPLLDVLAVPQNDAVRFGPLLPLTVATFRGLFCPRACAYACGSIMYDLAIRLHTWCDKDGEAFDAVHVTRGVELGRVHVGADRFDEGQSQSASSLSPLLRPVRLMRFVAVLRQYAALRRKSRECGPRHWNKRKDPTRLL